MTDRILVASMNPVALITGASRGIGRGIALALAKVGYDLVINFARDQTAAQQPAAQCVVLGLARHHPIRAEIYRADISLARDRNKLLQFTRKTFGRLDVLVNNAGVAPKVREDILEAGEKSFDRLMNINVKGPYFLSQLAAKWMIEQRSRRREEAATSRAAPRPPHVGGYKPKIITITSVSAYAASTNRGDYCISKAALSMVTPLFAARLAEHGINVFEIRDRKSVV